MFENLQIIDLSVPLEHNAPSEPMPAQIQYVKHREEGLRQMRQFFGIPPEDLVYSDGAGWAVEQIQAITHTGTHVDAPYHYGETSGGRPAKTIDQVPLEWCFAPGVVLDVTEFHPALVLVPLGMTLLGAISGIVPAIRAYSTDVAKNLVPHDGIVEQHLGRRHARALLNARQQSLHHDGREAVGK